MRKVIAKLKSLSPYSQSKPVAEARPTKESFDDFEKRTWKQRIHVNGEGYVFIPPMAFKNCLSEAAKFLGEKIPGKRNATWTKHFEAGVLVVDGMILKVKGDDVPYEKLFVPSDGVRGSGKRVWKYFPVIQAWEGEVEFLIFDDTITKEAFEHHLREAGAFIGLGRFRPRNNGFYGRFEIEKLMWLDVK